MKAVATKKPKRHHKCIESYNQNSGMNLPLKQQKYITTEEFENNALARMQKFSQKKKEKLDSYKAQMKQKEKSKSPFKPSTDKTRHKYRVNGSFFERLETDIECRKAGKSEDYKRYLIPQLKENTFAPKINKESNGMNRSYDDMLVWMEKRRVRTEMQREFNHIADYDERDFKPSIKSGNQTKARYMEPKIMNELPSSFFEDRQVFDKIDPELSKAYEREIRKDFIPKICDRSRELVRRKKKRYRSH